MQLICPECGFSATIDPGKIPPAGTMAGCPKCSCRFRIDQPQISHPAPAEDLLVVCPACSNRQSFSAVCEKCGIIFARYRRPAERSAAAQPPPKASVDYGKVARRSAVPAAVLLAFLLLWIFVKDLIPTTFSTKHETVSVTSALKHSVAVRSDGTVWTWGENKYGQLGNGRRDAGHAQPHKVPGIDNVVAVAAGERHTLALKKDGTVWSWGDNESYQLGDTSGSVGRTEPAQVAELVGVTAIGTGGLFSVALKSDGTLWYFGDNFLGGSGGGAAPNLARPRLISGIEDVAAVSCGRKSIVALKKNGTVWCWGENGDGQCGDGGNGVLWEPKEVTGLDSVQQVAAGEHFALALKKDGTVWAWGWLSVASAKNLERQSRPAPIPGLTGIKDIKAGYWLALALRDNGTVWHSGFGGKAAPGEQRSFADILKRHKTASTGAIFAGGKDAFLEKRDGSLLCWGLNDFGKAEKKGEKKILTLQALAFDLVPADGEPNVAAEAKSELPEIRFQAIAAGSTHSLALASDGTVWAWGENEAGQVTDKPLGSANTPRQVCEKGGRPLAEMVSIAAGSNTSLAVKRDGTLWLWGQHLSLPQHVNMSRSGSNGQWNGQPQNFITPTIIEGIRDAVAVAGGYGGFNRFVVLHGTGKLSRFGTYDKEVSPMQLRPLEGLTDVVALSAGAIHFAALKNDGTVWTWGGNDNGQLGNGTTMSQDNPQRVAGLSDVVSLATGNDVTVVAKKNGTVWGWGKNIYALTRKGLNVASSYSPLQIPGLKDIVAVAMPGNGFLDANHYLAVDRSGRVYSWGFNSFGQLGQGTRGHVTVKTAALIEGVDGVTAVAAGLAHSLALRSDGTIRSWGRNSSGQLGNASGNDSAFPVSVVSSGGAVEKKL